MSAVDQSSHSTGRRRRGAGEDAAHTGPAHRSEQQWGDQGSAQAFQALLGRQPSGIPLLAPPTPARHVPRPRLIRRLKSSSDEASLLVLAAPAGYGKSALLSEWVQSESRPMAWLTLTALDNDPDLLLERLAEALVQLAAPWPSGNVEEQTGDAGPPRIDLSRLPAALRAQAATLNAIGCDRVLVLDDVHNVRSADAQRILSELIEAGCAQLQIVLASRSEPALGLGRLRASGRLVQLGPADLEMT
ncbi:MAG TPA: AAA family ATPase, partial [Solirubrobacteraceae bacterium]